MCTHLRFERLDVRINNTVLLYNGCVLTNTVISEREKRTHILKNQNNNINNKHTHTQNRRSTGLGTPLMGFSNGNRTFNYNVAKKLINCYRR